MCFAWCPVLFLMGETDSRMVTRISLGRAVMGACLGLWKPRIVTEFGGLPGRSAPSHLNL